MTDRALAGEQVDEAHVTFLNFQTMLETLSPLRLDLLRYVRQHGVGNIRELALKRDYKQCASGMLPFLGKRDYKNCLRHQDVGGMFPCFRNEQ